MYKSAAHPVRVLPTFYSGKCKKVFSATNQNKLKMMWPGGSVNQNEKGVKQKVDLAG